MKEYVKYNKFVLLNLKPKNSLLLILMMSLLVALFISSCLVKSYENYSTMAYCVSEDGNYLNIDTEINDVSKITKSKFLKIDDKKYDFEVIEIGDLMIDEYAKINYQKILLKVNKNLIDNEIIKVNFYYDQERIIKKLIKFFK